MPKAKYTRKVKYTKEDLIAIANALNHLNSFDSTNGFQPPLQLCIAHIKIFYSKNHYIDWNDRLKKHKCYKKYRGWKP